MGCNSSSQIQKPHKTQEPPPMVREVSIVEIYLVTKQISVQEQEITSKQVIIAAHKFEQAPANQQISKDQYAMELYLLHRIKDSYQEFQNNELTHPPRIHIQYNHLINSINFKTSLSTQDTKDAYGISISLRGETNSTITAFISTKIQMDIAAPLAIIAQTDLFYKIMPFAQESKLIKICSRNERLSWVKVNIPFLSYRQSYFRVMAYNHLEKDGHLCVLMDSIHNREDLQQLHQFPCKIEKPNTPIDFSALITYTPKGKEFGQLSISLNVDPKVYFVPDFVLKKVVGIFSEQLFDNILKLSKKYKGSQWQEKVNTRPEMSEYFSTEVERYLQKSINTEP